MKSALVLFFSIITSSLFAQNYLAFDAKKAGEEKRAAMAEKEKNSMMTVKYIKPYDIGIKSSVLNNTAVINIELNESTDSLRLELFDSKGDGVELLFEGSLPPGEHQFQFIPKMSVSRPFIAVFKMADKIESMRVVKFNSF